MYSKKYDIIYNEQSMINTINVQKSQNVYNFWRVLI